jgi:DNA repair protein REV1
MVPGRRETTPTEGIDPSSSSFPVSSPSFWTEALDATETILNKLARSHSTSPRHDVQDVGSVPTAPPVKRARFEADTSLTYLPNRTDILDDDPHSYLANPEYAPNRFGDIGDYMRKKEIKVQTQNRDIALASALEGVPQIFAGLSFYINGNTHPPMEELRKMILQRGGEVRPVLRNKGMVKFIIAPMLTQSKFKQFERYKVVREGWILESCKEGKLLDWSRWKLQPEGGWESEGRKGLEGFLAGRSSHPTSTSKAEEEGDNGETSIGASRAEMDDSVTPVVPLSIPAATQSLLKPATALYSPAPRVPSGAGVTLAAPVPTSGKAQSSGPTSTKPTSSSRPSRGTRQSEETASDSDKAREVSAEAGPKDPPKPIPAPAATSIIPISPGAKRAETPMKEQIPANVQRPEGGWWEHYYTKDSNEDAARLLKDKEWRLKNTAERGNEGGFIDGYYQNSR